MLSFLKNVFGAPCSNDDVPIHVPEIDGVKEEIAQGRPEYEGLMQKYQFFSKGEFIGSLETELWSENKLLLVHRIDSKIPYQKQGTAMVNWLVDNTEEYIQPVHVIGGGLGFWLQMRKLWPYRIIGRDLRCSDYLSLLEQRKANFQ
ncbi:hypothetical protein WH95_19520 [Kiloniella litopenaei]|uniref:Uncharacterized protein n=1 Tax=Kiloniella litopenaei TaxID=1549748 RepID=A0A0M2R0R5_9PROT|nr:hypothetical protein [Kiloniella litopenaei]KKJ75211.1 hypothetical protein WH95_19520 [Kiloniella litopenaei]